MERITVKGHFLKSLCRCYIPGIILCTLNRPFERKVLQITSTFSQLKYNTQTTNAYIAEIQ